MAKAIASFNDTLGLIRTGRANPQVLYGVNVDYYGAETPINQIASISVVEGRQLVIKPYDTNFLKNIERAIFEANLNLTPQNDGAVVRINVPALTEESRKALCKDVSKKAEEAKVAIRNIRRDINEAAKKDDSLTEDMEKDTLEKIQKQTDEAIKKIDGMAGDKAKEIMTV
jgi:ribosome recycling factor